MNYMLLKWILRQALIIVISMYAMLGFAAWICFRDNFPFHVDNRAVLQTFFLTSGVWILQFSIRLMITGSWPDLTPSERITVIDTLHQHASPVERDS